MVLDLVFIAFIQNLLLLAVATPAYILLLVSRVPGVPEMTTADTMFSRGLVVVLILEALADQQQWNFQTAKHEYLATGVVPKGYVKEDLDRGFVVTGLWGLCRHPNFACEQAIWAGVYQWGCFQSDTMYNWTAVGVFVYLAVFQASTPLTEMITAEKYPEYKEYQRLVNKFVPGMNVFSGIADATTGSAEKIE